MQSERAKKQVYFLRDLHIESLAPGFSGFPGHRRRTSKVAETLHKVTPSGFLRLPCPSSRPTLKVAETASNLDKMVADRGHWGRLFDLRALKSSCWRTSGPSRVCGRCASVTNARTTGADLGVLP